MKRLLSILEDNVILSKFIILITFVVLLLVFSIEHILKTTIFNTTIEIGSNGALIITQGKKQTISYLYSASEYWENSGIEVKKGDKITIHASGRINLSLPHLVENTEEHSKLLFDWVDANGYIDTSKFRKIDGLRQEKRIMPQYNWGMLLMKIKHKNNFLNASKDSIIPIGTENSIEADRSGIIYFSLNEVLLDSNKEKIFVPDTNKDNTKYYKERGEKYLKKNIDEFISYLNNKNKNESSDINTIRKMLRDTGYQQQFMQWKAIRDSGYWKVWFDDNIGNFLINVEINK